MKHRYLYLLLLAIFVLSGCVKRELEIAEDANLRINFDWSRLEGKQDIPLGMQLCFYDENGIYLFSRHSSPAFYQERLPSRNYRILIYNPDATGVAFRNIERFGKAQIYTLPQQENESGSTQLAPPQNVYGISIKNLTCYPAQFTDTTVVPRLYVRSVVLRLKITGNEQALQDCSASIQGVAGSLNLSTGIPALGDNASVANHLQPQDNYYQAMFYVIGNDEQHPSTLSLNLVFADGTKKTLQENITEPMEQLNGLEETVPLNIDITIDVKMVDGVFVATLEEWTYKTGEVTVS